MNQSRLVAPGPIETLEAVPRPVVAYARDLLPGYLIPKHRHLRTQLIYATDGVMTVLTSDGAWAVPPQRALWMPNGIEHEIHAHGGLSLRTLYLQRNAVSWLPSACHVVSIPPLVRELILAVLAMPHLYDQQGAEGRLVATLLDQLRALPEIPLHLPMPSEPRLRPIVEVLAASPGDGRSLEQWSRLAGASPRTLARLFQTHTGMGFGAWRQQARLQSALARLAAGQAVTAIAFDLGYDSPSAFIAMFRRTLGAPPTAYLASERASGGRPRR